MDVLVACRDTNFTVFQCDVTCMTPANCYQTPPETISLVVKTDVFDFGREAELILGTRMHP